MKISVTACVKFFLSLSLVTGISCLFLRLIFFKKYLKLRSLRICLYTSCYGGYDNFVAPCRQTLPADILFFGDAPPPAYSKNLKICIHDSEFKDSRHSAKFFKLCPHEVPEISGYDVTVWIDSSCSIRSKYFLEMLLLSSRGPIAMRKHPDRSSIFSEALDSNSMIKYSETDLLSQARSYISKGLIDDHLWHCALIVRYALPTVVEFNKAWWHEMGISLQDQLSAPYAEYVTGLTIRTVPRWLNWFSVYSFDTTHRNHEYGSG